MFFRQGRSVACAPKMPTGLRSRRLSSASLKHRSAFICLESKPLGYIKKHEDRERTWTTTNDKNIKQQRLRKQNAHSWKTKSKSADRSWTQLTFSPPFSCGFWAPRHEGPARGLVLWLKKEDIFGRKSRNHLVFLCKERTWHGTYSS